MMGRMPAEAVAGSQRGRAHTFLVSGPPYTGIRYKFSLGDGSFGSPYLTEVPPIRPLRTARPDPACRPYGALATAPLLVTFRDRLRRGSFLARRAARVVGCSRLAPLMPFLPHPLPAALCLPPGRCAARF